jgi:hypothetical protein
MNNMSNDMKTGQMPSVSSNLKVGAENKKVTMVNSQDLMTHSSSGSRGGKMELTGPAFNEMDRQDPSEM